MPPSTDNAIERPDASIIRRSTAIFGRSDERNTWPPNPGFTVITRMMSTRSRTHATVSTGVAGTQYDTGTLAQRAYELQRAMQMRPRLGMHQDMIGAGLGKGGDVRIDRRDHQMHVERQAGVRPQAFQDRRSEADVGHEVPVHHIEMQPIRARRLDCPHFVAETGEIGGKQAWSDRDSAGLR